MVGIVDTVLNKNQQANDKYNNFVGMEANTIDVDDKSLVKNQFKDIYSGDSELKNFALGEANAASNSRGLLNSNMNTTAAVKGLIEKAMPIATADAATNYDAQKTNQAAENRADEITVDATNKAADLYGRTVAEKELSEQNYNQDYKLQELRGTQQKMLDEIAAQNQRVIAAGQNAALVLSQAQQGISDILSNTEWDYETKQVLLDKLQQMTSSQLATIGAFTDVNTGNLLNFGSSGGSNSGGSGGGSNSDTGKSDTQGAAGDAPQSIANEDDFRELVEWAKTNTFSDNENTYNNGERSLMAQRAIELDISPEKIAEMTGQSVENIGTYLNEAFPNMGADYIKKYNL